MDILIPDGYRTVTTRVVPGLAIRKTRYLPGPFAAHTHMHARFVFVVAGEFVDDCDGRRRECREGTLLFRPPGELHSQLYGPRSATSISVDIEPRWLSRLQHNGLALTRSLSLRSMATARLSARLDHEIETHDTASLIALEALLLEAAVEASRGQESVDRRQAPPWLGRAIEFLNAEQSRSVTLDEIGRAAGVHPTHLTRVFRRVHGCSIGEYLRRLRVQTARAILGQSHAALSDVAACAGFADQSHLCREFKRLVGVSPGRYRTLLRGR